MTLWTFVEAHITNIEMKHDALMKIAVNMHSLFGPIWQIFLPVYHRPSKRASCFISILENLASTKVHRAIVFSEMLGTFFWCQHRLAIAVSRVFYPLSCGFSFSNISSTYLFSYKFWKLNYKPISINIKYMCPLKSLRWILKTFKYKSYSPINVSNVFKSVYLYFLKFFLHNTQL